MSKLRMMKMIFLSGFVFALTMFANVASAGPAEDVAEVNKPRLQMLKDGNVDGYIAAYADNAVLNSTFSPFRIEGKDAIRVYFTELFRLYPKREVLIRHPATRVYNSDLVIQNGYAILNWSDNEGDSKTYNTRYSVVWGKLSGGWQIVEAHFSSTPTSEDD